MFTATDSPVSDACSRRIVAVFSRITRQSAGTRSPVRTSTTSPGTSSRAGRSLIHSPARRHRAVSLCISLSASSALSALLSCHTPTMALSTRMSRMTPGSTKSTKDSSTPGARSSVNASTNDTSAATRRIFTRASSNCSSTSFHRGLPSSLSSSLNPYSDRSLAIFVSSRPVSGSTPSSAQTSAAVAVHGVYPPSPVAFFFDGVLRGGMALSGERRAKRSEISQRLNCHRHQLRPVTLFQVSPPISAQRQLTFGISSCRHRFLPPLV